MKEHQSLRVSRFDAVTSALMTMMIFASAVTTVLMLLWWASRFESLQDETSLPPTPIAVGNTQEFTDLQLDFDQPSDQELEALVEPTFADSVLEVTLAASRFSGSLDHRVTSSNTMSTDGHDGASLRPGPDVDGGGIVSRSDRWQLNFTAKNHSSYADQLDFFKIELGAVGGKIVGLDIVSNLAESPVSRRLEDASTEKRLYFMFKRPSPLIRYERVIHRQAGVELQGRKMFKLIPTELENLLAKIELEYSLARGYPSVGEVAKTVFQSMPSGSGYQFEVASQRYRTKP